MDPLWFQCESEINVLWIRFWVIAERDPDPVSDRGSDPGIWWPKMVKFYSWIFFNIKTCNILLFTPPTKDDRAKAKILSHFDGSFCPPRSGSGSRQAKSLRIHADPDPQHCPKLFSLYEDSFQDRNLQIHVRARPLHFSGVNIYNLLINSFIFSPCWKLDEFFIFMFSTVLDLQGGSDISGTLSNLHCRIKNNFLNQFFCPKPSQPSSEA